MLGYNVEGRGYQSCKGDRMAKSVGMVPISFLSKNLF